MCHMGNNEEKNIRWVKVRDFYRKPTLYLKNLPFILSYYNRPYAIVLDYEENNVLGQINKKLDIILTAVLDTPVESVSE